MQISATVLFLLPAWNKCEQDHQMNGPGLSVCACIPSPSVFVTRAPSPDSPNDARRWGVSLVVTTTVIENSVSHGPMDQMGCSLAPLCYIVTGTRSTVYLLSHSTRYHLIVVHRESVQDMSQDSATGSNSNAHTTAAPGV